MAVRSVLILTAGFGEGHNAAARNLRDAITAADGCARVEVRDIFAESYGWVNRLAVKGYLTLINRAPAVWDRIFRWLDRSSVVRDRIGMFGLAARHLQTVIERFAPDAVVTTYPGYVHLLDHLAREGKTAAQGYVTIVTDSLTINSVWYSEATSAYVVANEETAAVLERAGISREKMRVFGFPVPLVFDEMRHAKASPAAGGRWRVLFMVNSGKRIAAEAARRLKGIENIELVVTVGRDDALESQIRGVLADCAHARVFGWTSELPRLMSDAHVIVSKAGGATVQECLAARTPVIVSQVVPGQEEGNARLLIETGAGVLAESADGIAAAVRRMISGDGAAWRSHYEATERLSRPAAARELANWLLGGEAAR